MSSNGHEPAFAPTDEMANAFPGRQYESRQWWSGLSKREWYAGMALAGLCQRQTLNDIRSRYDSVEQMLEGTAFLAFGIADAMLAEAAKERAT